jgi:hypothetical protein
MAFFSGASIAAAGLIFALGAAQASAPAVAAGQAPARWLGVFTAFEGARELCSQHALGAAAGGRRMEIAFTLYATTRPTADVVGFYARAHALTVEPGATTLTVRLEDGRKVLTVSKAAAGHPTCGVDPRPDEPTVIVVSDATAG